MAKKVSTANLMRLCFDNSPEYIHKILSQNQGKIVSLNCQVTKKQKTTNLIIDFEDKSRLRFIKRENKKGIINTIVTT